MTDDTILDFTLDVDTRPAVKAVDKFTREASASMRGFYSASEKLSKKSNRLAQGEAKAIEAVSKAYKDQKVKVQQLTVAIEKLESQPEDATEEERERAQEAIKTLQQELKLRQDNASVIKKSTAWQKKTEVRRKGRGLDKKQGFVGKAQAQELRESLKTSGEALVEPLRAFLARDAKGLFEASIKGIGKTFSQDTAKALMGSGALAKQKGAIRDIVGKRKGGLTGMAMQGSGKVQKAFGAGMGGAGQAIGGLVKALAPLAKILPILGMLGGAVMSLGKMFLDADSMVKEFNRGVMESASNVEYMAQYGSNSMGRLEKDLESLNKSANDPLFNNAIGITKDQHLQMLNVLNQEGVSLGYLSKQAATSGKEMGALSESIVASGVAYSRALGVPMQEIQQLQASMVTDMGSSLGETDAAFAKITRSAGESGIAGNKFFQMIKGVSQDLSVWNMRMEDSVDLLGRLTKVMDPRSAQKFFQEMTSGFQNMGRTDLLKQSMIAGAQATKEANQGTLARMQGELARSLNVDIGSIQGKGFNELYEMIQNSKTDQSQMGTMLKRLNDITTVKQGMKGGAYEQAYATRHSDTAGQLTILKDALTKFGGTLENPTSMAIGAVADSLGKSPDFVEALASIARTAKAQKAMMLKNAGTPEERKRIEGLSENDLINELGSKLLPKSDEEMKKEALENSRKQGQLTQDISTKLSNFFDGLMTQFYYLVMDIYNVIKSLYQAFVGSVFFKESFDKGSRAGGLEGQRLGEMLQTVSGVDKVSAVVGSQFSGEEFLKLVKNSGLSKEEKDKFATKNSAYLQEHKAGDYMDPAKMLRELGMDPSKVLGKAIWERDDKESSDALVNALGIQKSAVPQMMAPKTPGGPGSPVVTPETEVTPTEDEAKKSSATVEAVQTSARIDQDQLRVMKERGINVSKAGAKTVSNEFLESLRKALYEYYLYSGTDRDIVAKAFGSGGPTAGAMSQLTSGTNSAGLAATMAKMATPQPANAQGGMVTGISNGMAVVAAQGEGLTSIGKGERIVPAGGGGGVTIPISVSGIGAQDLARVIEGKVIEGIREYKRREKLY